MFDVVTSQFSSLLKEMQNNTLVPSPLSKRVGYFQGNTLVPSPLSKSEIFSRNTLELVISKILKMLGYFGIL
jgi:hypothetical protein